MDFSGQIDGAAFEGSKGDDVAVLLGGGRMLKDFKAGVTGLKAGERRQIEVPYPADYHNAALAGKTATFDVHVKKVEEKTLPELDEEFCREHGVDERQRRATAPRSAATTWSASSARTSASGSSSSCSTACSRRTRWKCRAAWWTHRCARCRSRLRAAWARRDASQVPPPEPFVEASRKRVALGLLVGELIRTRGIKLDRGLVDARLAEIAATYPEAGIDHKAYRQNADALRQVENLVIEDQVVELLLQNAKVKDEPATLRN